MSQFQVGRVSFASVLEALGGVIADEEGSLQAVAAAWRVAIAADEVSLEAPGGGSGAMSTGPVPGAGAASGSGGGMSSGGAAAPAGGGDASASTSKM
jgi:hypothetical protein